jgi:hypothetical protein
VVTGGGSCLISSRVGRVSLHDLSSLKEAFLKGTPNQLDLDGTGRNACIDLREYYCAAVACNVYLRRMLYPCSLIRLDRIGSLTNCRQMYLSGSLKKGEGVVLEPGFYSLGNKRRYRVGA